MLKEEQICQINLMNWLQHNHPEIYEHTYHFANERKCTPQHGAILKRMGVKKGVSDIFIGIPRNGKFGLWIELKVGSNKLSKEQKYFLEKQISMGYLANCVHGLEAAKALICHYFHEDKISPYTKLPLSCS